MKRHQLYLALLFFLSTFFACQNKKETPKVNTSTTSDSSLTTIIQERQVAGAPVVLIVRTAKAKAYERPDFSAPVLAHYQKNDSLVFTNRISQSQPSKVIEGLTYQEPWLRVILPNQKMAWIYGAHINFDAQAQPALAELVFYPRVKALFGEHLAKQIGIYQKELPLTGSLPAFRALYSRAQHIKDSLELHLTNLQLAHPNTPTDFFWLNELLNGFLLHYIPEQQKYYLFRDLKYWQQISQQTAALEDDAFIEVLLASYPSDSIAYYYYGWQLPLEQENFCSLLGTGIHRAVLQKLDNAIDSNSYFTPELQQIQQAVIDDITTSTRYWLPVATVQQELDSILQQNYRFLNRGNRVALKTKRAFLTTPAQHDLVVNLFEGK